MFFQLSATPALPFVVLLSSIIASVFSSPMAARSLSGTLTDGSCPSSPAVSFLEKQLLSADFGVFDTMKVETPEAFAATVTKYMHTLSLSVRCSANDYLESLADFIRKNYKHFTHLVVDESVLDHSGVLPIQLFGNSKRLEAITINGETVENIVSLLQAFHSSNVQRIFIKNSSSQELDTSVLLALSSYPNLRHFDAGNAVIPFSAAHFDTSSKLPTSLTRLGLNVKSWIGHSAELDSSIFLNNMALRGIRGNALLRVAKMISGRGLKKLELDFCGTIVDDKLSKSHLMALFEGQDRLTSLSLALDDERDASAWEELLEILLKSTRLTALSLSFKKPVNKWNFSFLQGKNLRKFVIKAASMDMVSERSLATALIQVPTLRAFELGLKYPIPQQVANRLWKVFIGLTYIHKPSPISSMVLSLEVDEPDVVSGLTNLKSMSAVLMKLGKDSMFNNVFASDIVQAVDCELEHAKELAGKSPAPEDGWELLNENLDWEEIYRSSIYAPEEVAPRRATNDRPSRKYWFW